jgi:hypothetical protein
MERHTIRPHIPLGLIATAVIVAALVLIVPISAGIVWTWQQWLLLSPAVQQTIRILLFGLGLGSGAAIIYVGLVAAYNRLALLDIVKADKTIALETARRPTPNLTSLSYSFHDSRKALPMPEQVSAPQLQAPIPSFGEMLDAGLIGPSRPLILGFDALTGAPLTGSWKDLYSCGVGAMQGAGKTWLLVFLLAQSAAQGGRLIVCDLHAGDAESLAVRLGGLAGSFMCNVADTPKAILSAFELANAKLDARKTNTARWPIILVCDEWTSLLRTSAGPALGPLVQNIAEQGRKFNVNGLLAAQAWTKDASSAVRNQLTSHYVLRQRPDEARYQLGIRAANLPNDIRELPDATGYFLNVKGEITKVIIPRMDVADIARAGEMIDRPAHATGAAFGFQSPTQPLPAITAEAPRKPLGSGSAEAASTAAQTARMVSPEAIRAADLFKQKMSEKAIVKELRGIDGGRNYETARNEVRNLILEGLLHENH